MKKLLKKFLCTFLGAGLMVSSVCAGEFKTPSGISSTNIESQVDEFMNKFVGKKVPGAQVSISKNGNIILSKGYGKANIEKGTPVTSSTTFNYASVSKLFIWTAAMQLQEQGKLDLKCDIRKYLPKNYRLKINFKQPVTFENLMNHNAGFEAFWSHHGNSSDFNSLGEATRRCYSGNQCFKPGEFQGYSNYGANLAAFIIENISGIPFYKYVKENIFKPCCMNVCYPERDPIKCVVQNKAVGYNGRFKKTSVYAGDWLYASGSVIGSADELSKFASALMPTKDKKSPLFKKPETLKKMLSVSYSPTGEELFSIHHGFWGTDGNYRGLGHTGCVEGMVSHFLIVPEENFSVSVLVNGENGWDITYGLAWLLTGNDYQKFDNNSKFPNSKLFEGEYVHARTKFMNRKKPFEIMKVESIDKNTIQVKTGNISQKYIQIRPYLFENITAKGGPALKSKIYFKTENGKVVKGITFKNDLIPLSKLNRFIK